MSRNLSSFQVDFLRYFVPAMKILLALELYKYFIIIYLFLLNVYCILVLSSFQVDFLRYFVPVMKIQLALE
jgi:hypothetical protein